MLTLIVKPTKHNKAVLEKRGLFSDDTPTFFRLYEKIMSDEIFMISFEYSLIDECRMNYLVDELNKIGIKF